MKQILNLEELKREQYNAGKQSRKTIKKYTSTERIRSLITNYNTNDIENFEKGMKIKIITEYLLFYLFFFNYYKH